MIIKSLFKRYERWNPVHPTFGAFWGVGVGIGCGVGWGPGFGPEVIGYVGAGCGAGFSVGFTLLGLGIGLPANYIFSIPQSAYMVTRRGALEVARARGLLGNRTGAGDGWDDTRFGVQQQDPCESLSSFKIEDPLENWINLPNVKALLISRSKCITDCLQRVQKIDPIKDLKIPPGCEDRDSFIG